MLVIQPIENLTFFSKKVAIPMVLFFVVATFFVAPASLAQDDVAADVAASAGLSSANLVTVIGNAISWFLGFLGLILLIIFIYAGFLYMTAGGDPDKVKKAKAWMKNGVIGLVIILLSYSIVTYIISVFGEVTGGGGGGGTETPSEYTPGGLASGSFGSVIQDHYPGVGETVPRSVAIQVTFKTELDPASIFATGYTCTDKETKAACTPSQELINTGKSCLCTGQLNIAAIQLYRACDTVYPEGAVIPENYQYVDENRTNPALCNQWLGDPPAEDKFITGGTFNLTANYRTIFFVSNPMLGSEVNDVTYFVNLTNNIKKLGAVAGIFSGAQTESYQWNFTTNTQIDRTPPYIISVSPARLSEATGQVLAAADGAAFPRNASSIIITFNEPVLSLTTLINSAATDQEITVLADGEIVNGRFDSSVNGYRSVVFSSTEECDPAAPLVNTCGDKIYCLPANAVISTEVKSVAIDNLVENVGPMIINLPAGGIVDASLNALDTNNKLGPGNGKTEGVIDNYKWSFRTSEAIDLTAPKIIGVTPMNGSDKDHGVMADSVVSATFNKIINPATVNNSTVFVEAEGWNGWYSGSMDCGSDDIGPCQTTVLINHGPFTLSSDKNKIPLIYPTITSGVRDSLGNCFNPCSGPDCPGNQVAGENCELRPEP